MYPEWMIFLVMLVSFVLAAMVLKWPIGISLVLASVAGAVAAGLGVPLRHLVEGTFAYIEPLLIITTAMIYMQALRVSGLLGTLSRAIIEKMHARPFWLIFFISCAIFVPSPVP